MNAGGWYVALWGGGGWLQAADDAGGWWCLIMFDMKMLYDNVVMYGGYTLCVNFRY